MGQADRSSSPDELGLSQGKGSKTNQITTRSATPKGDSLKRSDLDLNEGYIDEDEDWDHLWAPTCSPSTYGKSERWETVTIKGVTHTVPRFGMMLLDGYADFDGRWCVYPKMRQHVSSSVSETRNQITAYISMHLSPYVY